MTASPQHTKIAFIGAGNMTSAIITGMVNAGYAPDAIMATNPSAGKLAALHEQCGILTSHDNAAALAFADIIVLAVKPQMLAEVIAALPATSRQQKQYISIAAGVTIARIQEWLGAPCEVVRTMPNTPSSIGMGMTGLYAADDTDRVLCELAEYALGQVGKTLWVANEDAINGVIAAAGSAPAYLFLFAECMQAKTEALGFSPADAKLLVAQALAGAGQMLLNNADTPFSTLRENVTSKGGTTAQALASFNADDLSGVVAKAMQAAVDRAIIMQQEI